MTLMHERTGDCTGAGVQIFVRTPDRKIDIPIVERERDVANRVREIETDSDTVFLRCGRDFFDIQQLTGEKVHTAKHHYRQLIAVLLNKIDNLFRSSCELALARPRENERI